MLLKGFKKSDKEAVAMKHAAEEVNAAILLPKSNNAATYTHIALQKNHKSYFGDCHC